MQFVFGDPVVYWILRFATFFTLLFCGYRISYKMEVFDNKKYWIYCIPALIVYSLNYGLRWNRSYDYFHYYSDLTKDTLWADYDEPLYLLWLDFFKFTGLPYWVAFIFYSAILMYGYMLILKKYPKSAVWALPLFFILPSNVDNFVRQYFATAFLFLGLYFTLENKNKRSLLYYLCAVMVHFSSLFAIVLIYLFRHFHLHKIIKSPWILIVPYLLLYFFWDFSYLESITTHLQFLNFGEMRMQSYVENADMWFTDEGDINAKLGEAGVGSFSAFSDFVYRVLSCFVIYYGYNLLKNNNRLSIVYWSTIVALFISAIGGSIEIYSRFVCWSILYEPILIGLILQSNAVPMKTKKILATLIIFYFYGIRFVWGITKPSVLGYAFVWDF